MTGVDDTELGAIDPPEQQHGPGLGERAAKGALITFSGQFARILLQVVSVVVLARLLTPHAYGVVAMVLAVIGIGEIFRDFGLSSAAIQSKTLSRGQRDNLFWVNAGIGLVLATIVFFAAPLIAIIYRHPEVEPLARALSLTFLMNGLATQYRADLNRRLKFMQLTTGDVLSPAIGLASAIVGAALGWGAWALVAQQLMQSAALLVCLVSFAGWLPRAYDRTAPMRAFLTFGSHLVVTQLIGYAANNVDSLTIGIRFGATQLGLYNRSFQLLMTPLTQLRAPTTTVALPILARLMDDTKRYGDFVARGQLALGYSLVVVLGVVVGAADPATSVLLGSHWIGVAPILRLLAVAGIFQTLAYVGYWVYLSRGLTSDLMRYSIVTAVIKVTCIVVGSQWGIIGVATGYAIAPGLAWPLSLWWLSRRAPIPLKLLVTGALRVIVVAGVLAVSAFAVTRMLAATPEILQLVASVLISLAVGAAVVWFVPAFRRDVLGVVEIGTMVLRSRRAKR
ncbi:lipopolysaccharide biosynthesis protein [Galbitalea soli]|uniref:Lipopolysaccharide biosynthesis protein n=1 Tax=Galbitalea soli TaxID=1268042 RepID=A0A7C9PL79_9MICO|nr:lipopolysaccharide biosynthesis protein [Galbitalea soli]NEM89966.1 lipopolysaccharide biosynthesis protein [Galbitalea soli]NYJ30672.1 PST family polysaccharide transporter [Galbitalea soli]